MNTRDELLEEKQRLIEELDGISIMTDHGQRMAKRPEYGDDPGENASEVEELSNRTTLIVELEQALQNVNEKLEMMDA
jgi:hypothetical protein